MTTYDYLKFLGAFVLVIGLMGGLSLILRRYGGGTVSLLPPDKRRIKVVEILHLDTRRKAILLARDNKRHLVILGANSETLVETFTEENGTKNETPPL